MALVVPLRQNYSVAGIFLVSALAFARHSTPVLREADVADWKSDREIVATGNSTEIL